MSLSQLCIFCEAFARCMQQIVRLVFVTVLFARQFMCTFVSKLRVAAKLSACCHQKSDIQILNHFEITSIIFDLSHPIFMKSTFAFIYSFESQLLITITSSLQVHNLSCSYKTCVFKTISNHFEKQILEFRFRREI